MKPRESGETGESDEKGEAGGSGKLAESCKSVETREIRVALGHFHERMDECSKINEFIQLDILLTIYQKAKSKA